MRIGNKAHDQLQPDVYGDATLARHPMVLMAEKVSPQLACRP